MTKVECQAGIQILLYKRSVWVLAKWQDFVCNRVLLSSSCERTYPATMLNWSYTSTCGIHDPNAWSKALIMINAVCFAYHAKCCAALACYMLTWQPLTKLSQHTSSPGSLGPRDRSWVLDHRSKLGIVWLCKRRFQPHDGIRCIC